MRKRIDRLVQQTEKNGKQTLKDIAKRLKIAVVTYYRYEAKAQTQR